MNGRIANEWERPNSNIPIKIVYQVSGKYNNSSAPKKSKAKTANTIP